VRVVRAAPHYAPLADMEMTEKTFASLAHSGPELFLRTDRAVYCISAPPEAQR
jgi:hypothetical protein